MNYVYVGYDKEKGLSIGPPCKVYSVGVFIQGQRIYFSDFQYVAEGCVCSSNICKLESGECYDIMYGDPILIKGAKYIGAGKIDLPRCFKYPSWWSRLIEIIRNEFYIFEKGEMKIYVHTRMSVNINPHKEVK